VTFQPIPPELGPGRFVYFLTYILRELGLADTPTRQQISICEWMESGPSRQMTVGFRGVAKSTIAAVMALHRLRIDPFEEKVLIPGSTMEKAVEITTFMQRCIKEIDLLRCLEPRADGRSSTKAFDVGPSVVDQSPSVRAVGILSASLTGKRCTIAIPDDIETLNNSITPLKQERLAQAVTELEAILKPDQKQLLPRRIMYLGTPHLETSLYLRLVRERNYAVRYWPARYPDPLNPEQWECYEGFLDPQIAAEVEEDPSLAGRPTDPERFDEEELIGRESRMTRASVQLQFQLNCRISTMDRYPIRLGDLLVMDLDGKALPEVVGWSSANEQRIAGLQCVGLGQDRFYHSPAVVTGWVPQTEAWRCVLAIDPSGRGKDEMAWAVVSELNGNLFLLESGGSQHGYSEAALGALAKVAIRWRVSHCLAESNFGDGMFGALLQPVMVREYEAARKAGRIDSERLAVTVEEERSKGQKETRIVDTLAPLIQQHRLVVDRGVIAKDWAGAEQDPETGHQRSLMYQLSRITADRGCLTYYDRIDALAIGAAFFTEAAAQDQIKAQKVREDEIWEETIRAWVDETGAGIEALAMGIKPSSQRNRSYGGISR
jgi:hypothetical protein